MLNKKEITAILLSSLILAFVISLMESGLIFLYAMLAIFLVILINVFAKKIAAYHFESEIEIRMWEIKRAGMLRLLRIPPFTYGHPSRKLKKPFQIGAFLPLITTALSFGYFKWLATLVFDAKAKVARAAKRRGYYSFSEMSEMDIGFIAGTGILANLIFAIIGYLIGFPQFVKLNIYYAFFNLIPISELDGNKIFFGNQLLWAVLSILTLVGVLLTLLI